MDHFQAVVGDVRRSMVPQRNEKVWWGCWAGGSHFGANGVTVFWWLSSKAHLTAVGLLESRGQSMKLDTALLSCNQCEYLLL